MWFFNKTAALAGNLENVLGTKCNIRFYISTRFSLLYDRLFSCPVCFIFTSSVLHSVQNMVIKPVIVGDVLIFA